MADILSVRTKIMEAHDEASLVAGVPSVSAELAAVTAERDAAVAARDAAVVARSNLEGKIAAAIAALS